MIKTNSILKSKSKKIQKFSLPSPTPFPSRTVKKCSPSTKQPPNYSKIFTIMMKFSPNPHKDDPYTYLRSLQMIKRRLFDNHLLVKNCSHIL